MKQLKLKDLFTLTFVSAALVATARLAPEIFFAIFFWAALLLIVSSVSIIGFALLGGEQSGTMIDPQTVPFFHTLGRIWRFSAICALFTVAGIFFTIYFL